MGLPQGLSWSWQLDFGALMAALNGTAPSASAPSGQAPADGAASPDDGVLPGPVFEDEEAVQEQILDDLERYGGPRIPGAALAGRGAEAPARPGPGGGPPRRPGSYPTRPSPPRPGRGGGWDPGRRPMSWPRSRRSPPAPPPATNRPAPVKTAARRR